MTNIRITISWYLFQMSHNKLSVLLTIIVMANLESEQGEMMIDRGNVSTNDTQKACSAINTSNDAPLRGQCLRSLDFVTLTVWAGRWMFLYQYSNVSLTVWSYKRLYKVWKIYSLSFNIFTVSGPKWQEVYLSKYAQTASRKQHFMSLYVSQRDGNWSDVANKWNDWEHKIPRLMFIWTLQEVNTQA
jgi:hypothetical protein